MSNGHVVLGFLALDLVAGDSGDTTADISFSLPESITVANK